MDQRVGESQAQLENLAPRQGTHLEPLCERVAGQVSTPKISARFGWLIAAMARASRRRRAESSGWVVGNVFSASGWPSERSPPLIACGLSCSRVAAQ